MPIKPTVGRMVYYKTRGSADGVYPPKDFAAIITDVHDESIDLFTFGSGGMRFELNVEQGSEPGHWDWMPYQKDQQARLAPGTQNESHAGPEEKTIE